MILKKIYLSKIEKVLRRITHESVYNGKLGLPQYLTGSSKYNILYYIHTTDPMEGDGVNKKFHKGDP